MQHGGSISPITSLPRVPPDEELDTDDENDLEEHATVPFPASPFPYISGNGRLRFKDVVLLHWVRTGWILLFVIFYYVTVNKKSTYRDVLVGEMQNIMAELFPESHAKSAERIAVGEVAPEFVDRMNADEITKMLNRFQMYCMNKRGSDNHIAFSWHCNNIGALIGGRKTIEWDFINNSPFDSDKPEKAEASKKMAQHMCNDAFIKKHFVQGDDPRKVAWGDIETFRNMSLEGQRLNEIFDEFAEHESYPLKMALQHAEENAKKNIDLQKKSSSARAFSSLVESEEHGASQSHASVARQRSKKLKDNDLGLEATHVLSDVASDANDSLRGFLGHIGSRSTSRAIQNSSSQSKGMVSFLGAVNPQKSSQDLPSSSAPTKSEATRPNPVQDSPNVNTQDSNAAPDNSPDLVRKEYEETEINRVVQAPSGDTYELPYWCFEGTLVAALGRKLANHDITPGEKVSKPQWLEVAKDLEIHDPEYVWKRVKEVNNGTVDWKSLMVLGMRELSAFAGVKPPLLKTCRNHHWGAWHVCGFDQIVVKYRIELANKESLNQGEAEAKFHEMQKEQQATGQLQKGVMNRRAGIQVTFTFDELGKDPFNPESAAPTGWFASTVSLQSWDTPKSFAPIEFLCSVICLVLFVLLFLTDFVCAVVCLPWSLYKVFNLSKRLAVNSVFEVEDMLWGIMDPRGVQRQFNGPFSVGWELMCSALFCWAVYRSYWQANEPEVGMVGAFPNAECADLFRSRIVDFFATEQFLPWIEAQQMQQNAEIIPIYDYITVCLKDDPNVSVFGEAFHVLVFDYIRWHTLCLFFVCWRFLLIFRSIGLTSWVFQTGELAAANLLTFLLMYLMTLCCFTVLLHLSYGGVYDQFSTFEKTMFSLVMVTLGDTNAVFNGVETWSLQSGWFVTVYILSLGLMLVAIMMNFFTAIAVHAYQSVTDPEYHRTKLFERNMAISKFLCSNHFPGVHWGGPEAQRLAVTYIREYYLSYLFRPDKPKDNQDKVRAKPSDGSKEAAGRSSNGSSDLAADTQALHELAASLSDEVKNLKAMVTSLESGRGASAGASAGTAPAPDPAPPAPPPAAPPATQSAPAPPAPPEADGGASSSGGRGRGRGRGRGGGAGSPPPS